MSSRGEHRSVYAAIIDDAEFQELTADARLLFFILKLTLGVSGIDVVYASSLIEKCGKPQRAITAALKQLRDNNWIITERNVIWLRNGLRFEPSISLKNPKHIVAIQKHLRSLPRLEIVRDFVGYYGIPSPWVSDTPSDRVADTVSDTHSIPYPIQENREPEEDKQPASPRARSREAPSVALRTMPNDGGKAAAVEARVDEERRRLLDQAQREGVA